MSASSRRKGHNWEREVARDVTEATGTEHKRVLNETRDGNQGDVRGPGYVYQCKCGKRPDIYGAVEQAVEAAGDEIAVAAIHRTHRGGEKLAVLPWTTWLEIVKALA